MSHCELLSSSSLHSFAKRTLELRLPERWGVASDDDELGLARAKRLESRLVAKSDLAGLEEQIC